ncbi:MAG TPA: M20/M25/M40 family metallo-hydrolase, partial [Longimicrobiales bacterium]|nr:M20/M25/M40 family metallo-hydrolase [Longimicrobiales bacterium]
MIPARRLATLSLSLTLAASLPLAAQENQSPAQYRALAQDLLRELIEIDTNVVDGNITAAAEAMAARLRAEGFPDEDILVGGPTPTKGNLVVRYPGRDPSLKPLLALAHIDVVTANPADWTIPPFQFLERDGYFWGRGVTDDKDEAAIYVANLIRMKREGFVPERGIVVALTADEEGGDYNGVVWLLENHRDWIDAAYALNEGGGGMERNAVRVSNNVQASEKVYQSFTLEAHNPGGHSSLPVKKNAIYDLAAALLAIQAHDFPVMLNEVTEAYFSRTADIVGGALGDAMRRVLADP